MAILSVNTPYVDGGTVTSTNLNALVTDAAFVAGATDSVTTELSSGAIIVKDGGISENKLNTATQNKLLQGPEIEVPLSNTEAFVGGTKAGNGRGTFALDIQNKQIGAALTKVASGDSAVALGFENTASGNYASAVGQLNVASGFPASSAAMGRGNTASASNSVAFGISNSVTGSESTAVGSNNTVSNTESHAFGRYVQISSPYSVEMGIWSGGTTRKTAVKATYNGGIALTCENSASAPSDQSTAGAEDITELGRSMFTIQRNGDAFTLYFNDAGTVKSLALGTVI